MSRLSADSAWIRWSLLWWAAFGAFGCVTVYQPLVSLQRPSVVDPQLANFEGQRLLLRCIPGDSVDASDSGALCRRLRTLFANQGAQVEVEVPHQGRSSLDARASVPDLVVDLKGRLLHQENAGYLVLLSVATLTLVPSFSEYTFAVDVTIRDGEGSLLISDSLQARFIEYTGAGVWAVNAVLDLLVRSEPDKLSGDAAKKDFSRDLYAQLSQLTYNARARAMVLRNFPSPPPVAPSP